MKKKIFQMELTTERPGLKKKGGKLRTRSRALRGEEEEKKKRNSRRQKGKTLRDQKIWGF